MSLRLVIATLEKGDIPVTSLASQSAPERSSGEVISCGSPLFLLDQRVEGGKFS